MNLGCWQCWKWQFSEVSLTWSRHWVQKIIKDWQQQNPLFPFWNVGAISTWRWDLHSWPDGFDNGNSYRCNHLAVSNTVGPSFNFNIQVLFFLGFWSWHSYTVGIFRCGACKIWSNVIFLNPLLQEMASWKPIAPSDGRKQKVMYSRTC
jgi:hypothetical protein